MFAKFGFRTLLRAFPLHYLKMSSPVLRQNICNRSCQQSATIRSFFSTQKELSETDSEYLQTWGEEARAYYQNKQYHKARQALKKSADLIKRSIGQKQPVYARIMNNIGITYKIENKFDEAIEYIAKSTELFSQIQGDFAKEIGVAFGQIGHIYFMQKDYEKCYKYLKDSCDLLSKEKVETIELVSLLDMLGFVQKQKEHYQQAIIAFEKSLELLQKLRGSNARQGVNTLNQLGQAYVKLSKLPQAIKVFKKVYEIESEGQNKQTINGVSGLLNMAWVYKMMNNIEECTLNFEKGMQIAEKFFGTDHPDIAGLAQSLGMTYYDNKQFDKALPHLKKYLNIIQNTNQKENLQLDYANMATAVGRIHHKKQDYSQALKNYQRALQILQKDKKNEFFTASVLEFIGKTLFCQKEYVRAFQHYQKAHEIFERINGKEAKANLQIYESMANTLKKLDRLQEAEKYENIIKNIKSSQVKDKKV